MVDNMNSSSLWGGEPRILNAKDVRNVRRQPDYANKKIRSPYYKTFHSVPSQSPIKTSNHSNENIGLQRHVHEGNSDSNIIPSLQKTAKDPHFPVTGSGSHQFEKMTYKNENKKSFTKRRAVSAKVKLFSEDISQKARAPLKNYKQEVLSHKRTNEITKEIRFPEIRPIDSRGDASLGTFRTQESSPIPKIKRTTPDSLLATKQSTEGEMMSATAKVASAAKVTAPEATLSTTRHKLPPAQTLSPYRTRLPLTTEPDSRRQQSAHIFWKRDPLIRETSRESKKFRTLNEARNIDKKKTNASSGWKQNEINTERKDIPGPANNAHRRLVTVSEKEEENAEIPDNEDDLRSKSTWELILSPEMYRELSQPRTIIFDSDGKTYVKEIANMDTLVKTTALVRDRSRAIKEKLERQKVFNENQYENKINKTDPGDTPSLVVYLEEDPTYAPLRNIKLDFSTTRIHSNTNTCHVASSVDKNVSEESLGSSNFTYYTTSSTETPSEIEPIEIQTTKPNKHVDTNVKNDMSYNSPEPTETSNKTKLSLRNYKSNSTSDIVTSKKKSSENLTEIPLSQKSESSLLPVIVEKPYSHASSRSLSSREPRGNLHLLRRVTGIMAHGDSPCTDQSLRSPLDATASKISIDSRPSTWPNIKSNIRSNIRDAGSTSRKELTPKLPTLSTYKATDGKKMNDYPNKMLMPDEKNSIKKLPSILLN